VVVEEAIRVVPPRAVRSGMSRPAIPVGAIKVPRIAKAVKVVTASPRAALIGSLADAIRDASSAGDAGAAKIALEALTLLLAGATGP
jgi:hypothetical protein